MTENYLEFGEEINYQCNKEIADESAFQTQCSSTAYKSLYMFSQFTKFGRYGTASISVTDDWHDVITSTITNAPAYSSTTKVCSNMITAVQYEVLISQQGYLDDLQLYISAINVNFLQEDVTYSADLTNLPYRVIFTNYVLLPDDIRYDEKIPYKFPPDFGGKFLQL